MRPIHIVTSSGHGEEKRIDCTPPSLHKYKIGGETAQEAQNCLISSARGRVGFAHRMASPHDPDLTGVILAMATKDENGLDWKAFIYSKDKSGKELRYIGSREMPNYEEHEREIKRLETELAALKKGHGWLEGYIGLKGYVGLGRKIEEVKPIPVILHVDQGRVKNKHQREDPVCFADVVATTDPSLEHAVLASVKRDNFEKYTARDVSDALYQFENIPAEPTRATLLYEIGACYKHLKRNEGSGTRIVVLQGVDAFLFGQGRPEYTKNSMQQVASQFNFLESPEAKHNPMHRYFEDRTQGPYASLGCPGALAARNSFYRDAADSVAQPFFEGFPESYKKGYFEPSLIPAAKLQQSLEYCRSHVGNLAMLAQQGRSVFGPQIVQVFAAAPSFQGETMPKFGSAVGKICDVLVSHQYGALGKLAALHSKNTSRHVPLHVSLVGQGAFNNPREVMSNSFESLLSAVQGFDVSVYFHGYGKQDVEIILGVLKELGKKNVEVKTSQDFFKA